MTGDLHSGDTSAGAVYGHAMTHNSAAGDPFRHNGLFEGNSIPQDLNTVMTAWGRLSDAIKQRIVEMATAGGP